MPHPPERQRVVPLGRRKRARLRLRDILHDRLACPLIRAEKDLAITNVDRARLLRVAPAATSRPDRAAAADEIHARASLQRRRLTRFTERALGLARVVLIVGRNSSFFILVGDVGTRAVSLLHADRPFRIGRHRRRCCWHGGRGGGGGRERSAERVGCVCCCWIGNNVGSR